MSESECEFYGLLRHNYTVDVRFYLFIVGFRKCRIIYGRINETPLYIIWIIIYLKLHYLKLQHILDIASILHINISQLFSLGGW